MGVHFDRYTRFAPLRKASSTSACPIPRLAPVTRTALSAIVICLLPCLCVPGRRTGLLNLGRLRHRKRVTVAPRSPQAPCKTLILPRISEFLLRFQSERAFEDNFRLVGIG